MKKVTYLLLLITGLSAAAAIPPEVNEKVKNAFKATFADAQNIIWHEAGDKHQVDFMMTDVRVHALYDNEGNLLKTIKYYDEKKLPSNVLAKVKLKYADKKIFGVTEIATDDDLSFHIVLKDEKNWYWIESDAYGHLSLTKKLKRGDPKEAAF